jgi:hypothetical protein
MFSSSNMFIDLTSRCTIGSGGWDPRAEREWQCVAKRIPVQRESGSVWRRGSKCRERVAVCGEEDPRAEREWQCVAKRIQGQRVERK